MQEALLAPRSQWPAQGVPDNPRGWLVTVASRRLSTSCAARRRGVAAREARRSPRERAPAPASGGTSRDDDTLRLLFLCCHPALSPASQSR